ncbi:MAG TPA: hypothetical protein QGF95_06445, partial [Candidatus Latescibacteria bacterium]|nr:hypothetical protein [Candidatus Latescibacterota bacterium]
EDVFDTLAFEGFDNRVGASHMEVDLQLGHNGPFPYALRNVHRQQYSQEIAMTRRKHSMGTNL